MGKLAELAWDAFTLKHIKHNSFVFSYLLFLNLLLLFEIFLLGLYIFATTVFIQFSFLPDSIFFLAGAILILVTITTIPAIILVLKKRKQCKK